MVAATDFLENRILQTHLVDTTPYLGLWTTDPGDSITMPQNNAREVTGGMYVRKAANFSVSSGTATLQADITWSGMPATQVGAIVIYDAPTGGNAILHGPLVSTKTVGAGDAFSLPAANVTITCD